MAQTRGGKAVLKRGSAEGGGKAAALDLVQLKNRILAALNKLADRDTQQLAVEELERLIADLSQQHQHQLSSSSLSLFLSCLYETDAQQKTVVRRECMKLFGALATFHGQALVPHVPKIVAYILRRLQDPDSTYIRDACVDVMGILAASPFDQAAAAHAHAHASHGGRATATYDDHHQLSVIPVNVFVKPLLDALGEQNRNLQVGASLCLARVIDCTKDPHCTATLQQLCPRIVKLLSSPSFLANASLLPAVAGLAQVPGVVDDALLATLVSSVEDELEATEWATRKAAADTLACLATALGPALSHSKASSTAALVACRFDKVKPVRDSVAEALQLWKHIPDVVGGGTGLENLNLSSPIWCTDREASALNTRGGGRLTALMKSGAAVNASFPATNVCSKFVSEKMGTSFQSKKKTSPFLSDKKPNPDFFGKLENGVRRVTAGDWQIEVTAVPGRLSTKGLSAENGTTTTTRDTDGALLEHHHGNNEPLISATDSPPLPNGFGGFLNPRDASFKDQTQTKNGMNGSRLKAMTTLEHPEDGGDPWMDIPASAALDDPEQTSSWDASMPVTSPDSSSGSYGDEAAASSAMCPDWAMVCRRLQNMEHQQCIIMETLQEFMVGVHQNMQGLEGRVQRLERVVDGIAHSASSGTSERFSTTGAPTTSENATGCGMARLLAAADFVGATKFHKANSGRTLFADSEFRMSRDSSSWKKADSMTSDAWDDFSIGAHPQSPLPQNGMSTRRVSFQNSCIKNCIRLEVK
ncbi:unnamed protein product [Sphagnum compactum]